MANIHTHISKYFSNTNGGIATTFAFALIPIVGAVGAAVDYSRLENARSSMQNAADTAVLAAAIANTKTDGERTKLAQAQYTANYTDLKINKFDVLYGKTAVTLNVNSTLNTTFLKIIGFKELPVNVMAQASQDQSKVEVALVLDVSGSMRASLNGGNIRIDELKKAAKNLVDEVSTSSSGRSKFAIIPFTMNVNIGTKNASFVTGAKSKLFDGTQWKGCVQELAAPKHISNNPGGRVPAYIWPPAPNSTTNGMCKNPSNGTNSGYKYLEEADPALSSNPKNSSLDGPNRNCVRHEILPLTSSKNVVSAYLNSLTSEANDGTIIAPGVTWGLRALSPEWPFKEGDAWNQNTYKYMVVLTDGEQTTEIEYQDQSCPSAKNTSDTYKYSPSRQKMAGKTLKNYGPVDNWTPYGYITDSDPFGTGIRSVNDLPQQLESLSLAACRQAKKPYNGSNIEIFTIGVSDATAPGTRAFDLLNKCATTPDNHYYVNDAKSLQEAFKAISVKVKRIRLTQ